MTLKDLTVLDSEPRLGADFCFNLYDGKKAILLAAGSHAEKVFWMDDIAEAAQVFLLEWFHKWCSFEIVSRISRMKYILNALYLKI